MLISDLKPNDCVYCRTEADARAFLDAVDEVAVWGGGRRCFGNDTYFHEVPGYCNGVYYFLRAGGSSMHLYWGHSLNNNSGTNLIEFDDLNGIQLHSQSDESFSAMLLG